MRKYKRHDYDPSIAVHVLHHEIDLLKKEVNGLLSDIESHEKEKQELRNALFNHFRKEPTPMKKIYKFFILGLMSFIILFWISESFAQQFDPPGGTPYYTSPVTIDQAVSSQIHVDSLQMELDARNGLRGSPAMSMEEANQYEDIRLCQTLVVALLVPSFGLSSLWSCQ